MTKNIVDIIVVTYNRIEYIQTFIPLLYQDTIHPFRLIVVDNGSTDGTREYIDELVELGVVWKRVFNEDNLPLAKAFTAGFDVSESEFVVTVADDMKAPEPRFGICWLKLFVDKMLSDDTVGCINLVGARRDFNRFKLAYERKFGHSVSDVGLKKRLPITNNDS